MNIEEKLKDIAKLRPIDDVFFELFADDVMVCQEMLRIIMEEPELIVSEVTVQDSNNNIYGRSVRLDALCTFKDGSKCNIEVQRSDNDNHLKRTRYNAAMITVRDSEKGVKFEDINDIYVVYISEFDIFKRGRVIYHLDNVLRETGKSYDDGLHRIFVNTEIKDGSIISELMSCFEMEMVENPKFPEFSRRMKEIKSTVGGQKAMCEIMEKYENIAKAEGMNIDKKENAFRMYDDGLAIEKIAQYVGADIDKVKTWLNDAEVKR